VPLAAPAPLAPSLDGAGTTAQSPGPRCEPPGAPVQSGSPRAHDGAAAPARVRTRNCIPVLSSPRCSRGWDGEAGGDLPVGPRLQRS
jgi:hypothetical protein